MATQPELHIDRSGLTLTPICPFFPFKQFGVPCPTINDFYHLIFAIAIFCIFTSILTQYKENEDQIKESAKKYINGKLMYSPPTFTYDETSEDSLLEQKKAWARKHGFSDLYDSYTSESLDKPREEGSKFAETNALPDVKAGLKYAEDKVGEAATWGRATGAKILGSMANATAADERRAKDSLERHKQEGNKFEEMPTKRSALKPAGKFEETVTDDKPGVRFTGEKAGTWSKAAGASVKKALDEAGKEGDEALKKAGKSVEKTKELAAAKAKEAAELLN